MRYPALQISTLISLWTHSESFIVPLASQTRTFSRDASTISCRGHKHFLKGQNNPATSLYMSYDPNSAPSPQSSLSSDDMKLLNEYFSKRSDTNGLMTKQDVMVFPAISQLLKEDDISMEEFQEIWDSAPKSTKSSKSSTPPSLTQSTLAKSSVFEKKSDRIDWDSFVQIYREIDDLFEDIDDGEEEETSNIIGESPNDDYNPSSNMNTNMNMNNDNINPMDELAIAFDNLCNSPVSPPKKRSKTGPRLTKLELRAWEEIDQLIMDGMLGEDEFELLWKRTIRQRYNQGQNANVSLDESLDLNGFILFNEALDELFVFEDDEEDTPAEGDPNQVNSNNDNVQIQSPQMQSPPQAPPQAPPQKEMIEGEYLPPAVLFSLLADENFLVGKDSLKRWGELNEMLAEGDLLPEELESIFQNAPKAPGTMDQLNEDGFIAFYNAIDALFEDGDSADESITEEQESANTVSNQKESLLNFINSLNQFSQENDLLPCGLECTDQEQAQILEVVSQLEMEPQNICLSKGGMIQMEDLAGSWDLLYTSSSMMKFNKGLTGLGSTFPNGKFGGLLQNLIATKYITDVEYIERILVIPEQNSFDAVVNGDWELKSSVSLFTGAPSTIVSVEPDRVMYGPTTTRADHWKSVRSMNLLDLSYLDEDLRIMRGNTSTDTLFIFRRAD